MASFYCPSAFEIPHRFAKRFETFGMGEEAARNLARKINLKRPSAPIFVVGSAGALNPKIKVGEAFIVKEVTANKKSYSLSIPKEISFLPQSKLASHSKVLNTAALKEEFYRETEADLVDCESEFFLEELTEEMVDRIIMIRVSIDEQNQSMRFLNGFNVSPLRLMSFSGMIDFIRFIPNFFAYRNSMSEFFSRVLNLLSADENTKIENSY